jgi:hypothetical protein
MFAVPKQEPFCIAVAKRAPAMPHHRYGAGKHAYPMKIITSFPHYCLHGYRFAKMPPKQKKLEESGVKMKAVGKENGKRTGRPRE